MASLSAGLGGGEKATAARGGRGGRNFGPSQDRPPLSLAAWAGDREILGAVLRKQRDRESLLCAAGGGGGRGSPSPAAGRAAVSPYALRRRQRPCRPRCGRGRPGHWDSRGLTIQNRPETCPKALEAPQRPAWLARPPRINRGIEKGRLGRAEREREREIQCQDAGQRSFPVLGGELGFQIALRSAWKRGGGRRAAEGRGAKVSLLCAIVSARQCVRPPRGPSRPRPGCLPKQAPRRRVCRRLPGCRPALGAAAPAQRSVSVPRR